MKQRAGSCAVLIVCTIGTFCPCAWGKYGGGSGTASDPFLIYTAEHLRAIAENRSDWGYYVCWKLMADIDLASSTVAMTPIGTADRQFSGIFDGNGKTISNLRMTVASGDYIGLFGNIDAEIRDLTLTNVKIDAPQSTYVGALAGCEAHDINRCHVIGGTVSGRDQVGGLIGTGNCFSVSQCHSTCNVSGASSVGGLIGWNFESQIVSQCYATGSVSGTQRVGGLVGTNRGTLRDCYATGDVRGDMFVGGLVGTGEGRGPIWNCYATGKASCTVAWSGGRAGFAAICFSSYWDAGATTASSPYGIAKTTAQMYSAATFRGWGRGAAWTIAEGMDYPRLAWEGKPGQPLTTPAFPGNPGQGTAQSPYLIRTAEEFNAIGEFPGEWDEHYRLEADIDLAGLGASCRNIGADQTRFTGTFDGGGHSIANFQCPTSIYYDGVGLFGYAYGATIKRLTLVNPHVQFGFSLSVGPLVGHMYEGTMEACGVKGGVVVGACFVGGLVGTCTSATITRCYSTCEVTGLASFEDAGGLVGRGDRCNMSDSYAGGRVRGEANVGGLIGWTDAGSVSHCYCYGPVTGAQDVGGFIGGMDKTFVSGCFWDTQTSGLSVSAAGTGLRTSDMQKAATYIQAGWDFVGETKNGTVDIWCIAEGKGYPEFSQAPAPPHAWADDFEDGDPAPLWQIYEPNPSLVCVAETNGRLEVHTQEAATGQAALYVAKGWSLDASQDFSLKVNFRFNDCGGGKGWVFIGLTPNPAEPQRYRVEMKAGDVEGGAVYGGVLAEEIGWAEWSAVRSSDSGTLYISYDAEKGELYRSPTGYGPANAWNTVTDLLKNRWKGKPLYVFIGGSFTDMPLPDGSAWLDNFVLDSGLAVPQ